jgi:hypothetical protein
MFDRDTVMFGWAGAELRLAPLNERFTRAGIKLLMRLNIGWQIGSAARDYCTSFD